MLKNFKNTYIHLNFKKYDETCLLESKRGGQEIMKLISWNVNGIRAIMQKNFFEFVEKEDPDVLCIQESKAHPEQVDLKLAKYEHHYWNSAEKKGYSGTAVFSKIKPISVTYDMGIEEHDKEGRVIAVEFEDFYLITVYTPNSGQELARLDYRKEWDKAFLKYVKNLEKKKPIVICGDLNVAHTDIDLANPKSNYNKTAGYTQIEIDGFENLLKADLVDTFREFDKEPKKYTYWSYRFSARKRNVGWRIDYFLVSKYFMKNVKNAFILDQVMGSDHCPIGIEVKK